MSKNILVVCPKFPFPPNDGSKLANCSLLDCLSNLDLKIDVICFSKLEVSLKQIEDFKIKYKLSRILIFKRPADNFKLFRIKNALSSLLNLNSLPFTYIPFLLSDSEISSLKQFQVEWKHIIFEGLHSSIPFLKQKILKLGPETSQIYRAHNYESELWQQTAANFNFFFRILLKQQAVKVEKFEGSVINKIDKLWTLSEKDRNNLSRFNSLKPTKVIPVAFDFEGNYDLDSSVDQINLLFIGDCSWAPNRLGIEWFLDNVWEAASVSNKNLRLQIVGKNSRTLLKDYLQQKNVQIHDYVDNLDQIYATSDCCIIPIFTGSGVRIKAIEAACKRLAIVSTELGVSGLDLHSSDNYLKADNAKEWIEVLRAITKPLCKQMGERAHSKLKSSMGRQVVINKITEALV